MAALSSVTLNVSNAARCDNNREEIIMISSSAERNDDTSATLRPMFQRECASFTTDFADLIGSVRAQRAAFQTAVHRLCISVLLA